MINAGIGERKVNNLLATLNLPGIHHKSLKTREREVGKALEAHAELSCEKALEEESRL